jgi:hypothetical protein
LLERYQRPQLGLKNVPSRWNGQSREKGILCFAKLHGRGPPVERLFVGDEPGQVEFVLEMTKENLVVVS